MNIDAIRNRERNNQPPITQAERDRRDLLAEVDRLTAERSALAEFAGVIADERARIRAAVEAVGHYRCDMDPFYSCSASPDRPLGDLEPGPCDCYLSAVLAEIEGGEG